METQPNPGSRRTTRRADKYRQQSGVAPSAELMHRAAPEDAAPPVMERPKAPSRRARSVPAWRMPPWLTGCLTGMLLLVMALLAAQGLMQAYLKQRADQREAAYRRVVDSHPIYYKDLIEQYAAENNLKPAFVAAIILNESSFRTDAESSVGARGLMQLMPDTAEWIAGKLDMDYFHFDFMYDAEMNIRFGTWYLGYLSRLFRGDPVSVASAYHAGQGTVTRWLSDESKTRDGVSLDLGSLSDGPTKTYAGRVTQAYAIYEALYYPQPDGDDGGNADDPDGAAS